LPTQFLFSSLLTSLMHARCIRFTFSAGHLCLTVSDILYGPYGPYLFVFIVRVVDAVVHSDNRVWLELPVSGQIRYRF